MQLDFFSKLMQRLRPPEPPRPPPPPAAAVSQSAADLLLRAKALLQAAGGAPLLDLLIIRWNPRMRSTAGTAFPAKCLITLNPRLNAFGADEIDRTLRHELAHLLAHHRAGRRRIAPHGPEWQRACRDLDLAEEPRCHDLPLPRRRQTRRHAYACPACGTILQRVRPLRTKSACLACCRRHNGGRYDERFRLVRAPPPPPELASTTAPA